MLISTALRKHLWERAVSQCHTCVFSTTTTVKLSVRKKYALPNKENHQTSDSAGEQAVSQNCQSLYFRHQFFLLVPQSY